MFSWIVSNWDLIFGVFGVVQMAARLTPTPKDDEITNKVGKALSFVFSATNNGKKR